MAKRGSKEGKKVRGNPDARTLSPQVKTVTSIAMLEHMGNLLTLIRDAASTQRHHVSRLRMELGLPPNVALPDETGDQDGIQKDYFTTVQPVEGDSDKDRARKEKSCGLLLEEGSVIAGLRIYRTKAGKGEDDDWLAKSIPVEQGKEWIMHNQRLIEERAIYSEMNRQVVTAGAVIGVRTGTDAEGRTNKVRLATSPLKTIACRLMPHEGEILGGELTQDGLARAMDVMKSSFEREIGCEVISIAAHRMRNNDLHIHIQYTMVREVDIGDNAYNRRFRPWERAWTEAAEKSLIAEGKNVSPASLGKRKKVLEETGMVPPRPSRLRLEKQKGLRKLHNKTSQLGYSFKFKLNLLRAAEAFPEEHEIAAKVARQGDGAGAFREKILSKSDEQLQAEKIDYWLERRWREAVAAEVSEETRARLPVAALEEARQYAIHGTTQVEAVHLERHREAMTQQLAHSEEQLNKVLKEAAALEKRIADMAAALQRQEERLWEKRQVTADAIRAARKEKRQLERSRARAAQTIRKFRAGKRASNQALDQRVAEVETQKSAIPDLERAAEVRGVRGAFEAVFPGQKSKTDTAEGITREIRTKITGLREDTISKAKADADVIRKEAKDDAVDIRKNLAKRMRGMRTKMIGRDRARTRDLAVMVLGADRVETLTKSGTNLFEPIQKRLEWFRATLSVFSGLMDAAPPKGGPKTLAGQLVLRLKKLMASPHGEPISKDLDQGPKI